MLTRLGARCLLGGGRSLAALCALGLGAGCAVDSLDRLGAGNALVRQEPDASAEPPLDVPLRPDALELDAGTATQLAPPSHALVPSDSDPGDGIPELSGELLPNPGFEQGHEGWFGLGPSRIFDVVDAHGGSRAILSTNRAATWDGPAYDITALIEAERAYAVSLWVRNELDTQMVMLTLKSVCSGQSTYARLATRVVGTEWLQLTSGFFVPPCATALEGLTLYVEGPPAFKNLLVDDASLRAVTLSGAGTATDAGSSSSSESNGTACRGNVSGHAASKGKPSENASCNGNG